MTNVNLQYILIDVVRPTQETLTPTLWDKVKIFDKIISTHRMSDTMLTVNRLIAGYMGKELSPDSAKNWNLIVFFLCVLYL